MSDNPPAFPWYIQTNGTTTDGGSGMTLRDWFAGQAISGMVPDTVSIHPTDAERRARQAYQLADAMLEARKAKP